MMNSTHRISSIGMMTTAGNSMRACSQQMRHVATRRCTTDHALGWHNSKLHTHPIQLPHPKDAHGNNTNHNLQKHSTEVHKCLWRLGVCSMQSRQQPKTELTRYVYHCAKTLLPSMMSTKMIHMDVANKTACAPRMPAHATLLCRQRSHVVRHKRRASSKARMAYKQWQLWELTGEQRIQDGQQL